MTDTYATAVTRYVHAGGTRYAYRRQCQVESSAG